MSYLYPRLPITAAHTLIAERAGVQPIDLVIKTESYHKEMQYAPTGGNRVPDSHLQYLQSEIRVSAKRFGYPFHSVTAKAEGFDRECAEILLETMDLDPAEAAHIEMWAFLTTVLLPDVVRWRFSGEITSTDRFLGGDRGLRRNTFGRLWWRAYLLRLDVPRDAYHLLHSLNEDELVQITERPSIAAYRPLAQTIARSHIHARLYHPHLPRRAIMREGIKRIRRRMSLLSYELMTHAEMQHDVNCAFEAAASALAASSIVFDFSDDDLSAVK
jgi:hypothetical protein